jgi:hypothetical protein
MPLLKSGMVGLWMETSQATAIPKSCCIHCRLLMQKPFDSVVHEQVQGMFEFVYSGLSVLSWRGKISLGSSTLTALALLLVELDLGKSAMAASVAESAVLPELLHRGKTKVWGEQAYRVQTKSIRKVIPGTQDMTNQTVSIPRPHRRSRACYKSD